MLSPHKGFDMTLTTRLAIAAFASLLLAGPVLAQSTTTAPAKTETPASDKAAPVEKKARSAASLECSKEADEKGLKGKERRKFRSACKKEKAAGGAAATETKSK